MVAVVAVVADLVVVAVVAVVAVVVAGKMLVTMTVVAVVVTVMLVELTEGRAVLLGVSPIDQQTESASGPFICIALTRQCMNSSPRHCGPR